MGLHLLKDLEWILEFSTRPHPEKPVHDEHLSCPEARAVFGRVRDGKCFADALFHEMKTGCGALRQLFLGKNAVDIKRVSSNFISLSDGTHELVLAFRLRDHTRQLPNVCDLAMSDGVPQSSVLVDTDLKEFNFHRKFPDRFIEEPFLRLAQEEVANEIAFVGSLWDSIFPSHRAILTRTISVTAPRSEQGALFGLHHRSVGAWKLAFASAPTRALREEEVVLQRLRTLLIEPRLMSDSVRPLRLVAIDDLRQELSAIEERPPSVVSENFEGAYVVRRYSPVRSPLLDFGESESPHPPSRRDYVTTYRPGPGHTEFHRDFFVSPARWASEDLELYRAAFGLLHTLAIRRSGLFKVGFAQRVYSLLLPPAVAQDPSIPEKGYVFFPCLILYRVPKQATFRRTFTLTFIAVPIHITGPTQNAPRPRGPWAGTARQASIDEIRALMTDLRVPLANDGIPSKSPHFNLWGPLVDLLRISDRPVSIPELIHRTSTYVVGRVLNAGTRASPPAIQVIGDGRTPLGSAPALTFASSLESRVASMLLLVGWRPSSGEDHAWEKWIRTGVDNTLRDNVFKLLFYEDFLNPKTAYTSRTALDLKGLHVGNTLGGDMSGMTFYEPYDDTKLIVYPRQHERYPDYSIVRWMAFSIYTDSALASLQGMIHRFHGDIDEKGDLREVIAQLDDMIQSFVELYDLDIRAYFYRREYEKLRELLRIDRDYDSLLKKFDSVKDDATLREQRLINKLLVALAVSTVTAGILGTLAQNEKWSPSLFLGTVIPVSFVLTLAAYGAFDLMRRFFTRFK